MRYYFSFLLILFMSVLHAQGLKGIVQNENGERLEGAVIFIQGSQLATISEKGGGFILENIPSGIHQLSCSFLGYETRTVSIDWPTQKEIKFVMRGSIYQLDAVEIKSNVHKITPFNGSREVNKEEVAALNHGQDVPVLLQWQPSVTTNTDAGAGVGYTSMRIRGVEQSRINVTVNDIPINDAESQGVFWVDLPDIMSSTESVRIQRGVGPSTNGAGAYGGTVSLNTFGLDVNPSIGSDVSWGSFNTRKMTFRLNSGLMNNRFNIDARYSVIKSDGYIDRASADLKSWYIEAARVGSSSSLRFLAFSGTEQTYQAWNGVPEARVYNRKDELLTHYFNNKGSLYNTPADSVNLFQSDRRYNTYLYDNQVDNYTQTHLQLHYAKTMLKGWRAKAALHYTKGKGYFEQFKYQDELALYGLAPIVSASDTLYNSDIVRRRWLDNDFLGGIFKIEKDLADRGVLSLGGGYHVYYGNHFGELVEVAANTNLDLDQPYYDNNATKHDGNAYLRWEHKLSSFWSCSADAQLRLVSYNALGIDNDQRPINFDVDYPFFNPKISLTRKMGSRSQISASFAVAHREPDRSDFTDHGKQTLPRPERLYDTELSWKTSGNQWDLEANGYWMSYRNQLIPTGQLNDVGNTLRKNIEKSYRLGIEFIGQCQFNSKWKAGFNATLSQNKIRDFAEIIYDYTQGFEEVIIQHGDTDIALSPDFTSALLISYRPLETLDFQWTTRYVGAQYLDNTSNANRRIPAYSTSHFNAAFNIKNSKIRELTLKLQVNNVLNSSFVSGGYSYSYIYNTTVTENFLYPQAGIHAMFGLTLKF